MTKIHVTLCSVAKLFYLIRRHYMYLYHIISSGSVRKLRDRLLLAGMTVKMSLYYGVTTIRVVH